MLGSSRAGVEKQAIGESASRFPKAACFDRGSIARKLSFCLQEPAASHRPNCARVSPIALRSREIPYRLNFHVPPSIGHVTITNAGQLMDRNRSGETLNGVGQDSDVEIRLGADRRREIWAKMRILAAPATVFALLTDAQHMMNWLAQSAKADARPGGTFCLADLNGLRVEGIYLEIVRDQKIAFTWGGIDGLRPGQSTVEFALHGDGDSTLLRLRHFGLSDEAVDAHCLGWKNSGLPKLKAAAEGGVPRGTCLGDAADSREQHPYSAGVVW
jgi:uncharacterized protein YndB with AHSA1/START domain